MDHTNCTACTAHTAAEIAMMPVAAHEIDMDRTDRANKRLIAVVITLILAVIASNCIWLHAWLQYDYTGETIEYSQDGRGINIIGNDNEAGQYEPEISDTP